MTLIGFAGIVLVIAVAVYEFYASTSQPHITVEKIFASTGGKYSIHGAGYDADETVSLEIKNAPLTQPSGWHTLQKVFHCGRWILQQVDVFKFRSLLNCS